jgi:ribosomal-protein-alanine N-acetyltransferase
MDGILVRAASEEDREWAAALMASSEPWVTLGRGYESCLTVCRRLGDTLLIADVDGQRAGFVIVRPGGVAGSPYIPSIAVAPSMRSRGVGAVLLDHVASLYRGRARYLFLCVSSFNPRAREFYERNGFAALGEFRDFIIDGASEILMGKRL